MIQIPKFNFPLLELYSAVSGLLQPSSKWRRLTTLSRSPKHTPVQMEKENASPIKSVLNTQNSLLPALADGLWVVTVPIVREHITATSWCSEAKGKDRAETQQTAALFSLQSHCKRTVEGPTAIAISCTKVHGGRGYLATIHHTSASNLQSKCLKHTTGEKNICWIKWWITCPVCCHGVVRELQPWSPSPCLQKHLEVRSCNGDHDILLQMKPMLQSSFG